MVEVGGNATGRQNFLNIYSAPGTSVTAVPEYPAVLKRNQALPPLLPKWGSQRLHPALQSGTGQVSVGGEPWLRNPPGTVVPWRGVAWVPSMGTGAQGSPPRDAGGCWVRGGRFTDFTILPSTSGRSSLGKRHLWF